MQTVEEILNAIEKLNDKEQDRFWTRLPMLEQKRRANKSTPLKRGEGIRAVAGSCDVGKVLSPLPGREEIYEDRFE